MKRILFGLIIALSLSASLVGQVIYPLSLTVVWNPNPISDDVIKYTVIHNGVAKDVPPSSCGAIDCTSPIVVTSSAVQTVSVTATNQFGTNAPETITFIAAAPGNSKNVRIRVP